MPVPVLKSGVFCCGPAIMATAACILTIMANSRCNLLTVDNDLYRFGEYAPQAVGLWCYTAVNGNFYDISDYSGGNKFEAARALGTTTSALGFCVWLFYLFAAFCRFGPMALRLIGFLCFCCATFQGLVFLVYRAEICSQSCGLDTGGNCAIAAIVLWFVACLMSCAAGKPPPDEYEGDEEAAPKDYEE